MHCHRILLSFSKIRKNMYTLWIVTIFVNIGMWFERYNIVASTLSHDYIPAAWDTYQISWVELCITFGSFCWFFMWFLLFAKQAPAVAIVEIKEILPPPLSPKYLEENS